LQDLSHHGLFIFIDSPPVVSDDPMRLVPDSSQADLLLSSSCIAHGTTILTEHTTSAASQTSSLASLILPKIDHSKPQKLTYTHNQNFVHYIADAPSDHPSAQSSGAGALTYLVIAKSELGRRIPFGYLVEIKKRFLEQYPPENTDFSELPAYGAAAFNGTLKQLMVEFGSTQGGRQDAFRNVQGEIEDVRGIMSENIERVLERGERIDLLVDKTDRLGGSARDFRVRSRGLRRKMWWKNVRLMVLLAVVVVFLIYLFVGFGCGLPGMYRGGDYEGVS
jgi:vesicle-associated membrane protein 7